MNPIEPLPGASERLRDAGGRFPRRPGRPRKAQGAEGQAGGHSATLAPPQRRPVPSDSAAGAVVCGTLAPRLLDVEATAAYLAVSTWTVRDLAAAGKIHRVVIPTAGQRDLRRLLFDRLDLDALIERCRERACR